MNWLLQLLGGGIVKQFTDPLLAAYQAKVNAANDRERLAAEQQIAFWQNQVELARQSADVVKAGMQHRMFWVAWSIAAIPTVAWFGWGMLDSLSNGALPDVAALPAQLKGYADVVMGNIFYAGAALGGFQLIGSAIARRK